MALAHSRQSSNDDEKEFAGHGSHIIDVLTELLKRA